MARSVRALVGFASVAATLFAVPGAVRGGEWQRANPFPEGNSINAMAAGDGLIVAVGESGSIQVSTDGATWEARPSGTFEDLRGVAWGDGRFVAVGEGSVILSSSDGVEWTRSPSSEDCEFADVVWAGDRFVVVGGLSSSSNGVVVLNPENDRREVFEIEDVRFDHGLVWNGSQLFGVAWIPYKGWAVVTSANYISWPVLRYSNDKWRDLATDGQRVAALHPDGVFYLFQNSGYISFYAIGVGGYSLPRFQTVSWDGQQWVVSGTGWKAFAAGRRVVFYVSVDGEDWQLGRETPSDTIPVAVVEYQGSHFFGGTGGGVLKIDRTMGVEDVRASVMVFFEAVTSNSSTFVAVGYEGLVAFSTNGIDWGSRRLGDDLRFLEVEWIPTPGGGKFVAAGYRIRAEGGIGAVVASSRYGQSWAVVDLDVSDHAQSVVWNGETITVFGQGPGLVAQSLDGLSWNVLDNVSGFQGALDAVWDGTQFVVVWYQGAYCSFDGVTWSEWPIDGGSAAVESIAWSGSMFVGVSEINAGYTYTSHDGQTWTLSARFIGEILTDVIWTGRQFVAVNYDTSYWGKEPLFSSDDGATWTPIPDAPDEPLLALEVRADRWVAIGEPGKIFTKKMRTPRKPVRRVSRAGSAEVVPEE